MCSEVCLAFPFFFPLSRWVTRAHITVWTELMGGCHAVQFPICYHSSVRLSPLCAHAWTTPLPAAGAPLCLPVYLHVPVCRVLIAVPSQWIITHLSARWILSNESGDDNTIAWRNWEIYVHIKERDFRRNPCGASIEPNTCGCSSEAIIK